LKACSTTGALCRGRVIHSYILEEGMAVDLHLSTGLITMYTMCGVLRDGFKVFEAGPKHAVSSWNAIIAGCAQHQDHESAREYFQSMLGRNLKPNNATFAGLLSSCKVIDAVQLFQEMMNRYHILGESNHYDCFINLLGRGGYLSDAENMLLTIPNLLPSSSLSSLLSEIDHVGWISLLNNCKTHGNVKLGKGCFNHWVLKNGENAAGYLLMSNIYADRAMFGDAEKVEKLRKDVNAWKKPGKACLEVYDGVYEFVVGDATTTQNCNITEKFRRLNGKLKDEGYFPSFHSAFPSNCRSF
jgi:pentatricopeptide repeat protein